MKSRGVLHDLSSSRTSHQKLEFAFGVTDRAAAEHAIDDDDVEAHHNDAKHDVVKIARNRLVGNIGAEPLGWRCWSPKEATSATMLAFHQPPEAVIAPVM